jgi:hypothetical protein
MDYKYCSNCGKDTGHKRAIGWGTFFASKFTLGVSTLAIPFYPKRCIICGNNDSGQELNTSTDTISRSITFYDNENSENIEIPPLEEQLKNCSMCAEKIKLEALKCRFCGELFDKDEVNKQVNKFKEKWVNNQDFSNRILCSDGNCIGIIGIDGNCKECGKPFDTGNSSVSKPYEEPRYNDSKKPKTFAWIIALCIFFGLVVLQFINLQFYQEEIQSTTKVSSYKLIDLIESKNFSELNKLVKKGVNLNVKNSNSWTPLTAATWKGHTDLAKTFVEADADVNLEGINGLTPLSIAVLKGNKELLLFYIENNADLDKANDTGTTPLMTAAGKGLEGFLKILIEAGANINLKDNHGDDAIDYAKSFGHNKIIKILQKKKSS